MAVKKLGKRIRKYREAAELSRAQLAQASALSESFIAALEDEDLYPSLGPLQKVARALNLRLGTFLDDVQVSDPVVTHAAEHEADLVMQRSRTSTESCRYFSLGKGKPDRNMEPFCIELLPEVEEARQLSSHEGEEFIIVISGKLLLRYGEKDRVLEAGDSAYYNSIVPHYVGAAKEGPCRIYAVIYHPA